MPDFAAPTGEPASLPRPGRRPPVGIIAIAALVVFALIGTVLAPVLAPAADRFWQQHRPQPGAEPIDPGDRDEGASGVGDPYFPDHGNGGYDALGYRIDLTWDPATRSNPRPGPSDEPLSGTAVITATATQQLSSFYVDLRLPISEVRVDGEVAEHQRRGATDVEITPNEPIEDTDLFRVSISYGGDPGDYGNRGRSPWSANGEEVLVAGEPDSAAWWFPSNDHPSDPATMDVSIRAADDLEVISNGELTSRDRTGDTRTWNWVSEEPMATYLSFLAIGQFEIREGTTDGRPYVYAVSEQLDDGQRTAAFEQLERTPAIIDRLEEEFGPYPFGEIGGVVPVHDLWFAGLENQTRPVYRADAIAREDAADLLVHELAHMWFGDKITLAEWNDIFLNEAYASYAEWLLDERSGGKPAQQQLLDYYDNLQGNERFWQVSMTDPGRDELFSTVYVRGPMTLQALRNVLGDDAFFRFTRDWARRSGPHSLEQWMGAAQSYTSTDLDPFFDAWLRGGTAPARTSGNGLG